MNVLSPSFSGKLRIASSRPAFLETMTINVGVNDVPLRAVGDGDIEYSVRYPRWAAYVVSLGALLGIAFIAVFLFSDIEAQQDRYSIVADPVLSRTVASALFWALVVFWSVIWPWILIVMHRPFVSKLLERIIREVDGAAQQPVTPEP